MFLPLSSHLILHAREKMSLITKGLYPGCTARECRPGRGDQFIASFMFPLLLWQQEVAEH